MISRARELAGPANLAAVALTFEPHPAAVLGQRGPARLSSAPRKLELLAAAGLDATIVEPFTRELAALTPEAFLDQILLGALRARAIVVGYDFNYGCGRAGTIETLRAHGARAGIEIAVVAPVEVGGTVSSSSKIRSCLGAGELADATRLLGRAWDVDGVVVHGAKRGRAIGIPTANITPDSDLPLAPGIYAVTLAAEGGPPLPAVASLGTNPTFVEDGRLVLEVHVLDWDGDLYDRRVRTTFVARIRDELKYTTVEALVAQIHDDIARARELLR